MYQQKLNFKINKPALLRGTSEEENIINILENHIGKIPSRSEKYDLDYYFGTKKISKSLNPKSKTLKRQSINDFSSILKLLSKITSAKQLYNLEYVFYDKKNNGLAASDAFKLVFYPCKNEFKDFQYFKFDKSDLIKQENPGFTFPEYHHIIPDHKNSIKNVDLKSFIEQINGINQTFKYTVNDEIICINFSGKEIYINSKNLFDILNIFYQLGSETIDIYGFVEDKPFLIKDSKNTDFWGLVVPLLIKEEDEYMSFIETMKIGNSSKSVDKKTSRNSKTKSLQTTELKLFKSK